MRNDGDRIDPAKFAPIALNPFEVPDDVLFLQYYPEIRRNSAFRTLPLAEPGQKNYDGWDIEQIDDLLRIVAVIIDPDSPLSDSADMQYRVNSAVKSLGTQDPMVIREAESRGALFRAQIYNYFRLVRNYDFEQWWSLKTMYHTFARNTQNPPASLTKDEANSLIAQTEAMDTLRKRIASLSLTLFKDRESERIITSEKMADPMQGEAELRADDVDPDMGELDLESFN